MAIAQERTVVRNGKEFSYVKNEEQKISDEKTGFVWKDNAGKAYDIFITKNNACYFWRQSKKSGKMYRQYLPKDVSVQITREIGRKISE